MARRIAGRETKPSALLCCKIDITRSGDGGEAGPRIRVVQRKTVLWRAAVIPEKWLIGMME
jgi:hypothetical protein